MTVSVYEVELKFHVADAAALERRLGAIAARFASALDQVDRYFAHPCRDFAATDEALRLRRVGEDVAITWKGPRIGAGAKTREELELGLATGATAGRAAGGAATIDRWTQLLEALGFRQVREVVKRRRLASVAWDGVEIEIALDAVAGLGDFVELELLTEPEGIPQAVARLESLAATLGCTTPERRSYLELLLEDDRRGP
ncbi:MAG: class IV adenylate cyclase [Pirellulales bacterium]